jgi:hypothetical protein
MMSPNNHLLLLGARNAQPVEAMSATAVRANFEQFSCTRPRISQQPQYAAAIHHNSTAIACPAHVFLRQAGFDSQFTVNTREFTG